MWILYILLYLFGMSIAAAIFGYFDADILENPGVIFGILFWPAFFVLAAVYISTIVPYEIGKWASKYKDQIDLKSYLKQEFLK